MNDDGTACAKGEGKNVMYVAKYYMKELIQ